MRQDHFDSSSSPVVLVEAAFVLYLALPTRSRFHCAILSAQFAFVFSFSHLSIIAAALHL